MKAQLIKRSEFVSLTALNTLNTLDTLNSKDTVRSAPLQQSQTNPHTLAAALPSETLAIVILLEALSSTDSSYTAWAFENT
jgi:hypothetical protein